MRTGCFSELDGVPHPNYQLEVLGVMPSAYMRIESGKGPLVPKNNRRGTLNKLDGQRSEPN